MPKLKLKAILGVVLTWVLLILAAIFPEAAIIAMACISVCIISVLVYIVLDPDFL